MAYVQDKSTTLTTGNPTTSLTLTSTPSSGDLIIVSSLVKTSGCTVSALSGFGVGTWTASPNTPYAIAAEGWELEIHSGLVSSTPSSSGSVTFNEAPAGGGAANVAEFSGLSGSVDTTACRAQNVTGSIHYSPSL